MSSKSRSGSVDVRRKFPKNHHSGLYSRTISATKICRGDDIGEQFDREALVPIHKYPSNISTPTKHNFRAMLMQQQQQMEEIEEELKRTREKLDVCEMEKSRVVDQLKQAKNTRAEEDHHLMELESTKRLLSDSENERRIRDERIKSLEMELAEAREVMESMVEKDERLDKLKEELRDAKEHFTLLVSENEKRIGDEYDEVNSNGNSSDEITNLKLELQSLKKSLTRAEEEEKRASSRAKSVVDEMELIKNEWKLAIQAEEKSTKALEDLAFALKEVATESNHAKEKLQFTKDELEHVITEAEKLKEMVRNTEEKYKKLLEEAKQEAELHKNIADRLRVEADESLLAWNGKEMGFVTCIKRAEEEKATAQHESHRLGESLKAAENRTRAAREETYRLRDILKQAINESNAAKAASGIARDENSFLKDCLSDKEETLHFLSKENERLRVSEAAAHENVKQLKLLLSTVSAEYNNKSQSGILLYTDDDGDDEGNITRSMNKTFSFSFEDLSFLNDPEEEDHNNNILHEDPVKAEALKGSIFDTNAETPKSEPRTPHSVFRHHHRRHSYAVTEDVSTTNSDDFEQLDPVHDVPHSHRKMKTMFRRVGDLLTIRRGFHKKEASIDSLITTQPSS